jgi:hypothetical protein
MAQLAQQLTALTQELARLRVDQTAIGQAVQTLHDQQQQQMAAGTSAAAAAQPQPSVPTTTAATQIPAVMKPQKPSEFNPGEKGANVRVFLAQVDHYFTACGLAAEHHQARIDFTVTLLKGPAFEWWMQTCDLSRRGVVLAPSASTLASTVIPSTWPDFCTALRTRFTLVNESESARKKLWTFRQISSVQAYVRGFLALCAVIEDLSVGEMKAAFLRGLNSNIRLALAQQGVEEWNELVRRAELMDAALGEERNYQRRADHPRNARQFQPRPVQEAVPMEIGAVNAQTNSRPQRDTRVCYNCGREGHVAKYCRAPRKSFGRPGNAPQGNGPR